MMCGSYLTKAKLIPLFVNGLDTRIAGTIKLSIMASKNLAELLDRARKQGDTIRHIYVSAGTSMRLLQPLTTQSTRRRTPSAVSFADELSGTEGSSGQMYYMDNMSMPTEDLPSTTPSGSLIEQHAYMDESQQYSKLLALNTRLRLPPQATYLHGSRRPQEFSRPATHMRPKRSNSPTGVMDRVKAKSELAGQPYVASATTDLSNDAAAAHSTAKLRSRPAPAAPSRNSHDSRIGKRVKGNGIQVSISQSRERDRATSNFQSNPMLQALTLTDVKDLALKPASVKVQSIFRLKKWMGEHVVPSSSPYIWKISKPEPLLRQ
eukprot:IDg9479t1